MINSQTFARALSRATAYERLQQAREDGTARRGGSRRAPIRLTGAPRALRDGGAAAARYWELADGGRADGAAAYRLEDGWHWVGIVDGLAGDSALLSIDPDGARRADRYPTGSDAWSDLARYFEDAPRVELPTPAHFAQFAECGFMPWLDLIAAPDPADDGAAGAIPAEAELEYLEVLAAEPVAVELEPDRRPVAVELEPDRRPVAVELEPDRRPVAVAAEPDRRPVAVAAEPVAVAARRPLPWIPAEPEPWYTPEMEAIRARIAAMADHRPTEPVAVAAEPEPVAAEPVAVAAEPDRRPTVGRWRRLAVAVARAVYGEWWDGTPEIGRPRLVRRAT